MAISAPGLGEVASSGNSWMCVCVCVCVCMCLCVCVAGVVRGWGGADRGPSPLHPPGEEQRRPQQLLEQTWGGCRGEPVQDRRGEASLIKDQLGTGSPGSTIFYHVCGLLICRVCTCG